MTRWWWWWWLDSQRPDCCMSVQILGNICELARWVPGRWTYCQETTGRQHPYDAGFGWSPLSSLVLPMSPSGVRQRGSRLGRRTLACQRALLALDKVLSQLMDGDGPSAAASLEMGSWVMGDGVVSAAQYHARPVTGAPRPRQASCGLILLRGCLDSLRAKAAGPRVSDVRRDCGQIVPEAAQRRGPRSEAGTKSIPNHLGLLCSPIRSSVAENSKTPNPRPPFSSSPVCLHASHTLAVPCCHPPPPPPPPNATLLGGSTHRRLTGRPHRRIGPAVWTVGHSCRPWSARGQQQPAGR